MNSPSRPRNADPATAAQAKKGPPQGLRIVAAEGGRRAALPDSKPSINMPRASTDLSELLAGDRLICVRRPTTPPVTAPASPAPAAAVSDAELDRLTALWPSLPRSIRAAIMAMVRETSANDLRTDPPSEA